MALKEYLVNGSTYQFEESEAPEGAVLVESKAAKAPANKGTEAAADAAATPPAETASSGVEDASDPSASE